MPHCKANHQLDYRTNFPSGIISHNYMHYEGLKSGIGCAIVGTRITTPVPTRGHSSALICRLEKVLEWEVFSYANRDLVGNQGPAGNDLEHHQITKDERQQAHTPGQPLKPGFRGTVM